MVLASTRSALSTAQATAVTQSSGSSPSRSVLVSGKGVSGPVQSTAFAQPTNKVLNIAIHKYEKQKQELTGPMVAASCNVWWRAAYTTLVSF